MGPIEVPTGKQVLIAAFVILICGMALGGGCAVSVALMIR